MKFRLLLPLMLSMLFWSVAHAQPVETVGPAEPVESGQAGPDAVLAAFSEGLATLSGAFKQESYDDRGSLQESAAGQFYLAAPNLFRWDYELPYAQHIVADGRQVWVHDVDLEQVTVRPQSDAEDETPLSLLTRPEALKDRFHVIVIEDQGVAVLRLTPLDGDSQLEFVEAELAGRDLTAMHIVDVFGQRTQLSFLDVTRNEPLDTSWFTFSPPPGVDVVGDVSLGPELFSEELPASDLNQ